VPSTLTCFIASSVGLETLRPKLAGEPIDTTNIVFAQANMKI
jgi:hypothetical protein